MRITFLFCRELVCFLFLIVLSIPASATVYVDINASAGGDGTTWATAYQTIQDGINVAAIAKEAVWVAQGIYKEAIAMATGVAVYGGFQAGASDISERNPKVYVAIIDGATAGQYGSAAEHVVAMQHVTNVTLDGLVITGGSARAGGYPGGMSGVGGGIYCDNGDSSNTISNCVVSGNHAVTMGGGIECYQSSPHIVNCVISGNLGGGIACYEASPTLTNCVLSGNGAYQGAGIRCMQYSAPVLRNCSFVGNIAYGGFTHPPLSSGVDSERSSPVLLNCIFANQIGPAIRQTDIVTPATITNCLFYENYLGNYHDAYIGAVTDVNTINMEVDGASDNRNGDPLFLMGASGTWTAAAVFDSTRKRSTLTDSTASFTPGTLKGKTLRVESSSPMEFLITDNTTTQIEINFNLSGSGIGDGSPYLFVDYHLTNGSSALDRAQLSSVPSEDFEGDPRPGTDALADIGADEAPSEWEPPADSIPPVSQVASLGKYSAPAVFDVPYKASDAESGLQYVELFYRKDGQGDYAKYGATFTTSPISFDSTATGGDGIYEFYTIATDNSNNVEAAPPVPDAVTRVFGSFSGSRVYVDCDATGNDTGENWLNAFNEIDTGIFVANAFSVSSVWVAGGSYSEAVALKSNVAVYGGFAGSETDFSQRNIALNTTTIDASLANNGSPAQHAVLIQSVTGVVLDGFRIKGGVASASMPGGGICCLNAQGDNVIANCTITENRSHSGAGVFAQGSSVRFDSCVITNNDNNLEYGFGGGMYLHYCSDITISGCTISNNTGADGAGIYSYQSNVAIEDCIISNNTGTTYSVLGGGLHFRYGDSISVKNTIIRQNVAGWCGGGVYIYDTSPVFTNVILDSNISEWGGAGVSSYYAEPLFVNCTIINNTGSACGGFWAYYASQPSFINTIFQGNDKYAINAYGSDQAPTIKYCQFHNNATADIYIDGYPSQMLTGGAAINASIPEAVGNIDGDAQFVNLSLGDLRLSNLSPCVDAGSDLNAPLFDFAGNARPHDVPGRGADGTGKEFDIGAYENQDTGVYTPTNTPTQTATPLPTGVTGVTVWEQYR